MKDYLVRAVSEDGTVRAFGALCRETVETARGHHNTTPVATAALGRLLTASAMMGAMLKGEKDLITLQMTGAGPLGRVMAVCGSDCKVKGYVANPGAELPLNEKGKLDVGRAIGTDGFLTVITDLGLKEPYIGKIPLVSGEVGDDLVKYFAISEQVPSVVGLGVLVDKDLTVKHAGGIIVQVMPDATDETIDTLEKNIQNITSITDMLESGMSIEDILSVALEGFDFHYTQKSDVSYNCNCSKDRVRKVLRSVGAKELKSIIEEDGKAELGCQFCSEKYQFDKEELMEILEEIELAKKEENKND